MTSTSGIRQPKRIEIFNIWRSRKSSERIQAIKTFFKTLLNLEECEEEVDTNLTKFVKKECEKIRLKWESKRRRSDLFFQTYGPWLEEDLRFDNQSQSDVPTVHVSGGRPEKSFTESSDRSKRRKVKEIHDNYESDKIVFAAQKILHSSGKRDASQIVRELSIGSGRRGTEYKKAVLKEKKFENPYTPDEALSFFISNDLTVAQYRCMYQEAVERGFPLYPSYDEVRKTNKQCYPDVNKIIVTDISGEVDLQALLDHTSTRICKDVLGDLLAELNLKNVTLIYKWGCDGSSGHSIYKQTFENDDATDEYMFIISLVPIKLICDETNKVIWQNPRTSSARFCRFIKFVYQKETTELIIREVSAMENKIAQLIPTQVATTSGAEIFVQHKLILSMIDGKVCSALSGTKSTQRCYICQAIGKEMNTKNIEKMPNENMYKFGISCLHGYIRTMECLLNISYRLDIKEWQIRGKEKKEQVDRRKKIIQKKFKRTGLIIDKVKPGYGTSNDGNTARRFFFNYKDTASITGLDENLIYRFNVLLRAISSGLEIDVQKFQEYCDETRSLYLSFYGWYFMPVTVHKILVHGAALINYSIVPMGQLSEEPAEAMNKMIRKARLGHTFKKSRVRTNYDLINYLLTMSDPHITFIRQLPKKTHTNLDNDIYILLK